jgi:hypothetical protein
MFCIVIIIFVQVLYCDSRLRMFSLMIIVLVHLLYCDGSIG